jgi:formylglycine-generating enzyme required for sulfatase activity
MTTGFLAVTSSPIVARSRALVGALRAALSRSVAQAPLTVVLMAALVALTTRPAAAQCPGDVTGNGVVDGADLGALLTTWGAPKGQGDLNGDGMVDGADLGLLLTKWGPCITVPSWATLIEAQPDPAVVTSATLRAAITATGLAWRVKDTATQMEMLLIPPGSFQMGCSASNQYGCETAESPVHTVTLTNAFYLGRYEVTQAQWQARMGSNPSYSQSASTQVPADQVPNRPVERVSWNMIAGAGGFMAQTGMRLPTEAEWEYAYRAGTTTAFHGFTGYLNGTNNDTLVGNIAWYSSNSSFQNRPVGGKVGNDFGLHDMAGNVWEWVDDWYGSYSSCAQTNPTGPTTGSSRVLRGGSRSSFTDLVRGSNRASDPPVNTYSDVGFRAARSPDDAPAVTAVSPTTGPTAGGTLITLTGTNLTGATGVTVGGVACTSVHVVNATTVTAVTPAGTVGAKSVAVTTLSGTASLAGAFTYATLTVPSWATLIEAQPDPEVVWDADLRAAITATGLAWRVKDTATQMEMLLIPPGSFQMGCSASQSYSCYSNENPVHTVTLTNAFYLGRYEVTQAQWQARMGSNPSYFQSASTQVPADQVPNRPVERVSWNMIAGAGGFMAQTGMRLPTEAEWEYAYRAGTTTAFHGFTGYLNGTNDDTLVGNIAWYGSNSNSQTHPVGQRLGNGFGLHDMAGNVYEWVNDWYGNYSAEPQVNPQGHPTGQYGPTRVFRGGGWGGSAYALRASYRAYPVPGDPSPNFGCRAARCP